LALEEPVGFVFDVAPVVISKSNGVAAKKSHHCTLYQEALCASFEDG
jgi:hypothetical protein